MNRFFIVGGYLMLFGVLTMPVGLFLANADHRNINIVAEKQYKIVGKNLDNLVKHKP